MSNEHDEAYPNSAKGLTGVLSKNLRRQIFDIVIAESCAQKIFQLEFQLLKSLSFYVPVFRDRITLSKQNNFGYRNS